QFLVDNKSKAVTVKDPYQSLEFIKNDSMKIVRIKPKELTMGVIFAGLKPEANYVAQFPNEPKRFQYSTLNFKKDANVFIAQNGYFYEHNNVGISGYWAWNKVADMLPSNFDRTVKTVIDYTASNAQAAPEAAAQSRFEVDADIPETTDTEADYVAS